MSKATWTGGVYKPVTVKIIIDGFKSELKETPRWKLAKRLRIKRYIKFWEKQDE